MKKLSIRLADFLYQQHYIEEAMYSIYQYGIQMILEVGFSFITSVVICCVWGKITEGIIFFSVFIPLRSCLGGIHMKGYSACYLCSCITLIAILGLSSFEPHNYVSWLILLTSLIMIFLTARREKMRDAEGKHFYPVICVIAMTILIIGITFTILGSSSKLFLLACTNVLVVASKLLEKTQAIEEKV